MAEAERRVSKRVQAFKDSLTSYRQIMSNHTAIANMDNSFIENAFKRSIERSVSKSPGDQVLTDDDPLMNRRQSLLDLNKFHKHISEHSNQPKGRTSRPFEVITGES